MYNPLKTIGKNKEIMLYFELFLKLETELLQNLAASPS